MMMQTMDASGTKEITALSEARRTLDLELEGLDALRRALDGALGEKVTEAVAAIQAMTQRQGRLIVTGMGKSGLIGRKIQATLASTGTPAYFVHPGEASHGDLGMIGANDVVLALSWSGEAPELADIIAYTHRFRVPLIAITSRAGSALGRESDIVLELPAMPEACPNGLAPTTSTTMQVAMGDALAVALLALKGFSAVDFRNFHPGGKLGARLSKARDIMHRGDKLPLVSEAVKLSDAIVEMSSKGFGITGVVDAEGRLTGVLTDGDLRRSFRNGFEDGPVLEVMSHRPRSIAPDMLNAEVLAVLNEASITALFVVEAGKPVGILHIHDLLRAGVM